MSFRHREVVKEFNGGLNTRDKDNLLLPSESPDMLNVMPGKRGGVETRPGVALFRTQPVCSTGAQPVTSLFQIITPGGNARLIAFSGGELRVATDTGWVTLIAGLEPESSIEIARRPFIGAELVYGNHIFVNGADGIYWLTGAQAGEVEPYVTQTHEGVNEADVIGASVLPPNPRYIASYDMRVWMAHTSENSNRIYYCLHDIRGNIMQNYFTEWSWIAVPTVKDQAITGLKVFNDRLLVFTSNSIDAITPTDPVTTGTEVYIPPTYRMDNVSNTVGTVSNRSIQIAGSNLIFLAADGVYVYDGQSRPYKISQRIDPTINDPRLNYNNFAAAAHWNDKYLLSIYREGM